MLGAQRRQEILALLERDGSVSVSELSARFGTSEVTIRQDLRRLERQGALNRIYGGALAVTRAGVDPGLAERELTSRAEKRQIATAAAATVEDGDVVLLSDGTSSLEVARCLQARPRVTLITNSWHIVSELAPSAAARIVALGGVLHTETMAFVGPFTLGVLAQMRADRLFLGADGVSATYGISSFHMAESEVYRAMVASAKHVTALADHTKFGQECLYQVAALDEIDALICDAKVPLSLVAELSELGVDMRVADASA